jgi:nephrocystin-3
LLGERYGWVPDEIPQDLIEQEPWLQEHLHQSVTELEILHGVLNDPAMADRALFYFRDRAFIDSLPPDEQPYYLELPTKEEIERFGQQEAERHTQERRQKLAALKARIRTSRLPVRENYPNPQALGERVLRDLTEIIERFYPIDEVPDPLDREALDHDAFAESRAKVYIDRQAHGCVE